MKLTDLPSGETLEIFTSPSSTPTQCSAASPLRQTNPPADTSRMVVSAATLRRNSSGNASAQRALSSDACADAFAAVRFMLMRRLNCISRSVTSRRRRGFLRRREAYVHSKGALARIIEPRTVELVLLNATLIEVANTLRED